MRKIDFITGEYYHIYNRGVDKREVFLDEADYWKFFDGLRDFNNRTYYEERLNVLGLSDHSCKELSSLQFKELGSFLKQQGKVVDIISYSFNPNHFHFVLRQLEDRGVSNLMHKLGTSYTNAFNKKNNRSGSLFQGTYKAKHIENNDYLLWLIGYVNGNIEIHELFEAENYNWSSYQALCRELSNLQRDGGSSLSNLSLLSGLDIILSQFRTVQEFQNFIKTVINESRTKKEMEKYLLEKI